MYDYDSNDDDGLEDIRHLFNVFTLSNDETMSLYCVLYSNDEDEDDVYVVFFNDVEMMRFSLTDNRQKCCEYWGLYIMLSDDNICVGDSLRILLPQVHFIRELFHSEFRNMWPRRFEGDQIGVLCFNENRIPLFGIALVVSHNGYYSHEINLEWLCPQTNEWNSI